MIPKVGIILINYKDYAKRFLADCRDSLRALDYPADGFKVYIVDNETSPETRNYLKEIYPEATIILSEENAGWGGGNNLGVRQALKDGCQDVVFLNMDVIVDKDWLKELVAAGRNHYANRYRVTENPLLGNGGQIGVVQSKILLHQARAGGAAKINSLGNEIHFLGFGFCRGYGETDRGQTSDAERSDLKTTLDIPYASGASMYVKGEVFKKVGLCNPDFFMYHDDLEFCLRAKLAGWRIVLAPQSVVWHKYQFSRSIRQIYYMERNRLMTLMEFYKIPTLILIFPALLIMELGVFAGSLVSGYAGAKLRSWGYFLRLKNWQNILEKRRKIQATRGISDCVLMSDFTGRISFQEVNNPILNYFANPIFNAYWQIARRLILW